MLNTSVININVIVKELLAFSRNKHKLIDPTIIFKQSCTILNDLEPRDVREKTMGHN